MKQYPFLADRILVSIEWCHLVMKDLQVRKQGHAGFHSPMAKMPTLQTPANAVTQCCYHHCARPLGRNTLKQTVVILRDTTTTVLACTSNTALYYTALLFFFPHIVPNGNYCEAPRNLSTLSVYVVRQKNVCTL